MLISESGMVTQIKKEYKHGYDIAVADVDEWKRTEGASEAARTPLVWGRLCLYQKEDGMIHGVDRELLRMLESPERGAILLDGDRFVWHGEGQSVWIGAYRPSAGQVVKQWRALEAVNWSEGDGT